MFEKHKEIEGNKNCCPEKRSEDSFQSAAISLAAGFQKLFKDSIEASTQRLDVRLTSLECHVMRIAAEYQQKSEETAGSLISFGNEINQLATKQQQAIYSMQKMEQHLEVLNSQGKLLENSSKENHLLGTQHYLEHIIEPMIRSLFPVYDVIESARSLHHQQADINSKRLYNVLEQLHVQLTQFFLTYQIEPIRNKHGAEFDPKMMKPIKYVQINKRELHGRIAECIQIGFRQGEQRILRPEGVAIYEYKNSELGPVADMKGTEYVNSSD